MADEAVKEWTEGITWYRVICVAVMPAEERFGVGWAQFDTRLFAQRLPAVQGCDLHLSEAVALPGHLRVVYEALWPTKQGHPDLFAFSSDVICAVDHVLYDNGIRLGDGNPKCWVEPRHPSESDAKAAEALARRLTPAQREDLENHGAFEVAGSLGTRYRIARERQVNVTEVATGGARWCLVMPDVPIDDQLLAQALLIQADEGEFRRQAATWAR